LDGGDIPFTNFTVLLQTAIVLIAITIASATKPISVFG